MTEQMSISREFLPPEPRSARCHNDECAIEFMQADFDDKGVKWNNFQNMIIQSDSIKIKAVG